MFRSRIPSLQSATKKFLSNRTCLVTVFFLEFCPCQFRPECPMTAPLRQNHKRKNHEKIQTQTPGSTILTSYPYCTHVLLLWEMVMTNKKQSNLYADFFFGAIILGLYWGYGMIISFNLYTISSILYQSMINTSTFIIYLISIAAPSGSKPQIISFHEGHIKIKSRSSGGFSSSPSIMPWQ